VNIERFELERWMSHWELLVSHDICESGILPMSLSELYSLLPNDAASRLEAQLRDTPAAYSEARGTVELRTLLAETYTGVSAEDVLVTTGAIEANFLVFNALIKPGDHVVAVSPAYQQLHSVPRSLGADVDLWDLAQPGGGFAYDLDRLESLLRPDTRMIVINTPHNPTGAILTSEQLDRVIDLARERDAWILSDEAYRWLAFPDGETLVEPTRNRYDKAISVGTVSKPFGMPGLRIGWLAANAELAQQSWALRDYITLSPAKMSDAITCALIEYRDQIMPRNQAIMSENLETAREWFARHSELVGWTEPRGALLAMMTYTAALDSTTLANRLAEEAGVMLAPGAAFGLEGHLRIGIGQRPSIFREGLEKTSAFLQTLA
jgi:aspartate/methionine/tyrosine aminotransferase